jgi:LmbE family N-acetylglucosaminyl deacetylase
VRVMAISVHPDDETLGCGGTLLKHRAAGDEIHWLIASSRTHPRWPTPAVKLHQRQIQTVARAYDVMQVTQLGHPDAELDMVPMAVLIDGIAAVVSNVRPEVVYVVHGGDVHSDHVIVHAATMSAIKAFRMTSLGIRRVLAFETLSSTDAAAQEPRHAFLPTVYSDITGFLEQKCRVMQHYSSELQGTWLPRTTSALTALARLRGATVGVEHAEAFVLLRELV